jgi:foldase protein PrsA
VASVNGEGIRLARFERELARFQQRGEASDLAALRSEVLNNLIQQVLIAQEAGRAQIVVTDAEVEAEMNALRGGAGSDTAWQEWLAANLYTEDEVRDAQRLTLITSRLIEQLTTDLYGNVAQVHARHIVVDTAQSANDILSRLQNGEDFAVLSALSRDATTREVGGDLGWFTQEELVVPALATVAFSLEPGQIAGPVQTDLGFHVIQTLERADLPLTDERRGPLIAQRFESWVQALVAGAQIDRYI